MSKIKFVVLVAFAAFCVAPVVASADAPKVSYSAKKQGRVVFQKDAQDEVSADKTAEQASPENIEPAAGGSDLEEKAPASNLSKRMKLPRKN